MTSLGRDPLLETAASDTTEEMDDVTSNLILVSDADNFSQTD